MQDPKGKGYGQYLPDSPGMVCVLLNELSELAMKPITAAQGTTWAAAGAYASIYDASVNVSHPCRSSCMAVMDAFKANQAIHLEMPELQTMLGAWLQTEVITLAQYEALIFVAMQPASRLEVLGLDRVTEQDLQKALETL